MSDITKIGYLIQRYSRMKLFVHSFNKEEVPWKKYGQKAAMMEVGRMAS
jgi:hypothetical protein